MIHVQTYYLTAVLALALSGISLVVSLISIVLSERHRKADRADKQANREADLAYKYSKEVQASSLQSTASLSLPKLQLQFFLSTACPDRGGEVQASKMW